MKARSQKYYDRVAKVYDATYDASPYWDFYRRITWEHFKPFLPRTAHAPALDVGGGTGIWALRLHKAGLRVTLSDISDGMLDRARANLAGAGVPEDAIPLVRADITDLEPFADAAFDFVLAQGDPLSYSSHPARAMKSIDRVLRPGGILVASVDAKFGGIEHFFKSRDLDGLEKFLRDGRTEWLAHDKRERFPITMFSPDEIQELVTARGFEVLSLCGKLVLPVRQHPEWLEDRDRFDRLLRLERQLHKIPALLGRAAHLEIVARKPSLPTAQG